MCRKAVNQSLVVIKVVLLMPNNFSSLKDLIRAVEHIDVSVAELVISV